MSLCISRLSKQDTIRNSTPRFTKPRLFSVNQANIKQDTANKKLKRISKKCFNCQPFVHYTVFYIFPVTCITFRSFEWLYFVQKVAWLKENFSILWRSMCTFWHCTYCVHQAKILYSNLWKSQNPELQCLEKPNSWILMIVKHKPLNQILEKPKSRIPMFEKVKFQKFTV